MSAGVLIAGGGHAGGAMAAALRQAGYADPIVIVGEEPLPPYQRPPLSKAWLKGEAQASDLLLRPAEFYAEKHIELRLGTRVTALDRAARSVTLSTGERLSYDHLVLATGSRLRKLTVPGHEAGGVLELRTAADAEAIKAKLSPDVRLAVVGGGYVGLEVAASARALGAQVTVFEREARLLARVASEPLSAFFQRCHGEHGVHIELGASVSALESANQSVSAVLLSDGRRMPCDLVVVGIGALANDGLAREAGLACDDGIVVDERCRTSDDAVYAIGDCTRRPVPRYGRALRLESVPNALEQARQAAADLCGKPPVKSDAPWFWSDQYDVRLQIVGMPFDVVSQVVRGDPASGRFAVFHLDAGGRLQALEAVNSPGEFAAARQWVSAGQVIDAARAADGALTVRQIVDPAAAGQKP